MNKNLKPWDVSEHEFPHTGSLADKLEFCLRYAVLAHSAYNTQPWYFVLEDDTVSLYADRRYALPVLDPDDRQLVMACGSALYNLRLAIRYFGYREFTQLLPNPADENLVARVQISDTGTSVSDEDRALFHAIKTRHANRSAFKNKPVPADALQRLREAAQKEGAWLYVCEGDERDIMAHFIAEGDQIQMSSKTFRRELASWANERRFLSGDGYPDYAQGHKDVMSSPKPQILRRFEAAPGQVVQDDEIAAGCPVIAVLGSEKGSAADRVYAGQAFMRVLLQAEAEGLSVSTLNQPCEVPEIRLRIHDEIDHKYSRAQFILRIGYGDAVINYNPRRPLETFIDRSEGYGKRRRADVPDAGERAGSGNSFFSRFLKLFS